MSKKTAANAGPSDLSVIPLSAPDISQDDVDRVSAVLRSGKLVQGTKVREAEVAIANLSGSACASLVSNGTASLHIALIALGIGIGDEVIVPAFSYVATANVVEIVGARCVFVDIDIDTFNVNTKHIEEKITLRTKAIMPVHEFGLCANMTDIMRIANHHGIPVIEDAACAIGATHNGRQAGTFGSFGSFSFHPRKSVTAGEGGCLLTQDLSLDKQVRTLRNHGIKPDSSPANFVEAGFNYRMTDIQGAMLLGQLERLPTMLARKRAIACRYLEEMNCPQVALPSEPDGSVHSWQTFHVLFEAKEKRDAMVNHLRQSGVESNYGAQCIPAMTYYRKKYGEVHWRDFPNAYRAYTCGLAIPIFGTITDEQVERVIHSINNFDKC